MPADTQPSPELTALLEALRGFTERVFAAPA
jgi:hypothetical protein